MMGKVLRTSSTALAAIVLSVSPAWAQSTGTVPLPGGPAGAGTPVFVHPPAAQPVAAPEVSTPAPPTGAPQPATSTAPVPASKSDRPATPSIPQLTSFPELTRGVGTSETLLKD
jgi:hypothetical protein